MLCRLLLFGAMVSLCDALVEFAWNDHNYIGSIGQGVYAAIYGAAWHYGWSSSHEA